MTDSIRDYDCERQQMRERAAAGSTHARDDTPTSDARLRALLRPIIESMLPSIRQHGSDQMFRLRAQVDEQAARIEALEQRLGSDRFAF